MNNNIKNNSFITAFIYKLIDGSNNKILYIGGTKNIGCRLSKHKSQLKKCTHPNKYLLEYFKINDLNNLQIVIIEILNVETKQQMYNLENFYIEKFKNEIMNINAAIPLNKKEYYEANKNKLQKYYIDYRIKNNKKFSCETCLFYSHLISNFKKHLNSISHKHNEDLKNNDYKIIDLSILDNEL